MKNGDGGKMTVRDRIKEDKSKEERERKMVM